MFRSQIQTLKNTRSTNQYAPARITAAEPARTILWARALLRLRTAASNDPAATTMTICPISTPKLKEKSDQANT